MTKELCIQQQLSSRRAWLCRHVPRCGECAEAEQIQLVEWFDTPATWKCRICGHRFTFEPETRGAEHGNK